MAKGAVISVSIQMKLLHFAVLGVDPAHGAGDRAHHHGMGVDAVLGEAHAAQERAVGYAGGGDEAIAAYHVVHVVFLLRILDAHGGGPLPLSMGVEGEPALDLDA